MIEIMLTTVSQLRQSLRQVLALHLIFTALGIIVFAPLLGAFGHILLKLSGKPAVADIDLLLFALSPAGMGAFILFAAVTIVIIVIELASLMAVAAANKAGNPIDVINSLSFSFARIRHIFEFAIWLVLKLGITVLPFIVAGGVVAFVLITDHDINYYLAVQPPEFWTAIVIIGFIGLLMIGLLLRRLVDWSLALPLVLFAGKSPAQSFSASTTLTRNSRRIILQSLVAWVSLSLLLGAAVTLAMHLVAQILVPIFVNSVSWLAIMFGLLTAALAVLSTLATVVAIGGLAVLVTTLLQQLEPGMTVPDLKSPARGSIVPLKRTRRLLLLGLLVSVIAATLIGHTLLDEIDTDDDVQVIAHRGASAEAPENTMASIRRAIADGTDWIEIDVQESADGIVVVVHDSDFMKLAGVDLRVWEGTLQQITQIDVGSRFTSGFAGEAVPTLAAVLAEVKGRSKLIVELKYYGHSQQLEQRVIDLIEAADMQKETMIMSLEYAGIQKVRALRPEWKIGLLSARAIGDLTRLDADFLAVNTTLAGPALIKAAHDAGKELFVWTVNDALSMSQMMSLGVDGIITDLPALGREVLMARAELSTAQRLLLHMAPVFGVEAPSLRLESNDAGVDGINSNLELGLQQ